MCNVAQNCVVRCNIDNCDEGLWLQKPEYSTLCSGEDNCLKDVLSFMDIAKFILYLIAGVARFI